MKDVLKIMLNGTYTNFKRILFASDRVTDMELRNAILTGTVEPDKKVDEKACIGCGGCANVCPTGAVTMKPLQNPVKIKDGWVKTEVPELDPFKCVVCYWCHDFCPIYSFFEEAGTIHPGNVGEINVDTSELLSEPIKISQEKISFIAQYLSDKSLLSRNIVSDTEDIENVGVGLERVSKIKDIHDNINEKYEKDVQRSSALNEDSKDSALDESADGPTLEDASEGPTLDESADGPTLDEVADDSTLDESSKDSSDESSDIEGGE